MNRRTFLKTVPALAVLAAAKPSFSADANTSPAPAPDTNTVSPPIGDLQPIAPVKPQTDGGKTVLAALQERKTIRNISAEKLSPQALSNLLWAAWGVNRQAGPFGQVGRTAASASNSQEIDLYVVMPEGTYLYEAAGHRLVPVVAGDLREGQRSRPRRHNGQGPRDSRLRRRYRQIQQITASGTRPEGHGDTEVLLQRRHRPHCRQRVSVRRLARTGRVVSQLQ